MLPRPELIAAVIAGPEVADAEVIVKGEARAIAVKVRKANRRRGCSNGYLQNVPPDKE
jgi:hypothetical protein